MSNNVVICVPASPQPHPIFVNNKMCTQEYVIHVPLNNSQVVEIDHQTIKNHFGSAIVVHIMINVNRNYLC